MQTVENWAGGLVDKPGTYKLSESGQVLRVWIDEGKIVHYELQDNTGHVIFATKERASAFHRWAIFFDGQRGQIWFDSSDIGTSVATKAPDGNYSEIAVASDPSLIRAMPQELFGRLTSSTKGFVSKIYG